MSEHIKVKLESEIFHTLLTSILPQSKTPCVWYFQVQMDVTSWFVQDQLKGDNVTELRIKFIKRLEDAIPAGED